MVVVQESQSKKKKRHDMPLRFTVTQHKRDLVLFNSLIKYLRCGRCYSLSRDGVYFIV